MVRDKSSIPILTILTTLKDSIAIVEEVAKGGELKNETIDVAKLIFKQYKKDFGEEDKYRYYG